MAKKTKKRTATVVRSAPAKPTVIKVSGPAPLARRARKGAARARAHVISGAKSFMGVAQNQLIAVGGAAGLAFLQKSGVKIPKLIDSLSVPANAGLIAWGAARLLKNATLDHVATGLLSAAAYAFAGGAPIQGDIMGEGSAVVFDGDDE